MGKQHQGRSRSLGSIAAMTLALGCGLGLCVPASAGSFKINPVQIYLPSDRLAASLKMTNSGAVPASVRVVTYTWTQADGHDVYSATRNVIVSPPIFTIPAGQTQLVRVGLRDPRSGGAYRVIFEEIPKEKPVGGQVQITLRLNLPLYVVSKEMGRAELTWAGWRDAAGDVVLEGRNRGTAHAQIVELDAEQDGRRHLLSTQMGVVLPKSARQWKIGKQPELQLGVPFVLTVKGSAGDTRTPITLERR